MSQEERGKAEKQRGRVCRVTHWVSSRGEGDGLHVMVGNYLWRKQEQADERRGKTRGEHVGDVTHVGSEMKACGWRDKCGPITEGSALFSKQSGVNCSGDTLERGQSDGTSQRPRRINKGSGRPWGFFL